MEIKPIAIFRSPVSGKFGLPRQAGLVGGLRGRIVLEPEFRSPDALRGLDGFDYVWLIWEFNLNHGGDGRKMTVRPPRLGGNERVGVFASRSPFRPNPLGLSSVRVESIDFEKCEITVLGADLADGTPIYDIKPYVTYSDCHEDARSGFVDGREWKRLKVVFPDGPSPLTEDGAEALSGILAEDPRPQYHSDPDKVYGMTFEGYEVKFRVRGEILEVISIE